MRIETTPELEAIAAELRRDNPGRTFVVDSGAVWLRENGKDLGLYSLILSGGPPVCCVENGQTVLHRATPKEGSCAS